mgnify:CR=1 FL=1
MTPDTSGRTSRQPFASHDRDSSSWRTSQLTWDWDLTPSLVTLPRSGSMRSGRLYERPKPVPPTLAPDSSSSPGLLATPTANLGRNGGSQHPEKRKAGGHGPTLADQVEHLLPTPEASDGTGGRVSAEIGGTRTSGAKRAVTLATALHHRLLPTPLASNGDKGGPNQRGNLPTPTARDHKRASRKGDCLPGAITALRSLAGNESPANPHPPPLW